MTDPRDRRCEHGIRWPHPCDDCHDEAVKPHNLITRIEALEAERDALRDDAERWRAFFGSARFSVMGAVGFDWENSCVREPRDETNCLHFTLNIWDRHPEGGDAQGTQGRAMLLSYVDHLRAAEEHKQ